MGASIYKHCLDSSARVYFIKLRVICCGDSSPPTIILRYWGTEPGRSRCNLHLERAWGIPMPGGESSTQGGVPRQAASGSVQRSARRSVGWSFRRLFHRSVGRLVVPSVGCSIGRWFHRLCVRSFGRPFLSRSLVPKFVRSFVRSLFRSFVR